MVGTHRLNVHYKKGLELYDRGRFEEAIDAFSKAIEEIGASSPEGRLAKFYIGECHLQIAEEHTGKGSSDKAEEHLREAIEKNPHYPDLHYQLAVHLDSRGETQEAFLELEHALELNPSFSKALLMLGILAYKNGEQGAGIKYIIKAVECEPRLNIAAYRKGVEAIVEISRETVKSPADFAAQVESARRANRKSVLLLVQNDAGLHFVPLRIDGQAQERSQER